MCEHKLTKKILSGNPTRNVRNPTVCKSVALSNEEQPASFQLGPTFPVEPSQSETTGRDSFISGG
jgi:hypothetical protein